MELFRYTNRDQLRPFILNFLIMYYNHVAGSRDWRSQSGQVLYQIIRVDLLILLMFTLLMKSLAMRAAPYEFEQIKVQAFHA